jgi:hypothetical protein
MGEVPERPIEEMDTRRPAAALVLIGPGCVATPADGAAVLLLRPKNAVKVLEVMELRRVRGGEVSLGELSSAMLCFVRCCSRPGGVEWGEI